MFEAGGMINSSEALKSCTVPELIKHALATRGPGNPTFIQFTSS